MPLPALGRVMRHTICGYFRTTRSVWFSMLFDLLDLLAGSVAAILLLPMLRNTPWMLSVFPILLTIRGAGNGIFSGVLTTSLHIGTIEPRFGGNTEYYYSLLASIATMSIINSLIALSMIAILFMDIYIILLTYFVMLLTIILALCFSLFMTSFVGFFSFRRGINPDDVVYPVMSTLNDIMISIFLLVSIITIRPSNPKYAFKIGPIVCIIIFVVIGTIATKFRGHYQFRKTIREGILGIFYAVVLSSIAGYLLSRLYSALMGAPELMIVLPLLMTLTGDAGTIIASRYTTALNIGEIGVGYPRQTIYFLGETSILLIAPYTSSLVIGIVVSIITSRRWFLARFVWLIIKVFQVGFLSILVSTPIVIFISFQTFKYGLNPDNFSIPIVTSTSDFLTILFTYLLIA